MSYQINYHREPDNHRGLTIWHYVLGVILAVMALTNGLHFYDSPLYNLREQLMPWTNPAVQSAYAEFCQDLAGGEPFSSSLETFAESVMHYDAASN